MGTTKLVSTIQTKNNKGSKEAQNQITEIRPDFVSILKCLRTAVIFCTFLQPVLSAGGYWVYEIIHIAEAVT